MDQPRESLLDTPVIEKVGYHYFVHPMGDGVPMLRPGLLCDPSPPSRSSCQPSGRPPTEGTRQSDGGGSGFSADRAPSSIPALVSVHAGS